MYCDKCGTDNMGSWSTVGFKNYCQSCMEELEMHERQTEAAEAVARRAEEEAAERKQQSESISQKEQSALQRQHKNLLVLIKHSDLEEIKHILRDGSLDVNQPDFVLPVFGGEPNPAKEYLKNYVDINAKNSQGETALFRAVCSQDAAAVDLLLSSGADIDFQTVTGRTALMMAASCGDAGIMQRLLERGANIGLRDCDGNSPLMWAADNGHCSACQILVEAGLAVDEHDSVDCSALNHCLVGLDLMRSMANSDGGNSSDPEYAQRKQGFVSTAEYLIKCGADVDNKDFQGRSALSLLKKHTDYGSIKSKTTKNVSRKVPKAASAENSHDATLLSVAEASAPPSKKRTNARKATKTNKRWWEFWK